MNHWDIAAAETKMRADLEEAVRQGDRMIAAGEGDASFIHTIRHLDEARLQFVLGAMKAENEGHEHKEILAAAGYTIGTLWGTMNAMCVGAVQRQLLRDSIQTAFAQSIGAEPAAKAVHTVLKPMMAGHA